MKTYRLIVPLSLLSITPAFAELGPEARPKVIYTPIVLTGQPAPGLLGNFSGFPYHSVINDAHYIVFFGATNGGFWPNAIYLASPTGISLVAREGQSAPDYPAGTRLTSFDANYHRVNDAGQVTFESWLTGPGLDPIGDDNSNAYGNWLFSDGQLHRIAQNGMHAPGTPDGVNIRALQRTTLNDLGQVAFSADLWGPAVNGLNDTAFFFGTPGNLQLLAREGDAAPGGVSYGDMSGFDYPVFSPKGKVTFLSSLMGGIPNANRAIFAGSPGSLELVAKSGDEAPGTTSTFRDIHAGWNTPRINDRGDVFFASTLNDGSRGIWTGSKAGQLQLVAQTGRPARDLPGQIYDFFFDLGLNERGDVTFRADVQPTDDEKFAIYAGRPNNPQLIAATGQHAPGTEDGVVFGYLTDPVINKDGQVAFFGYLTGANSRGENDYGIFATGHSGDLRLIARYGDDFTVGPGDIRTIQALSHAGVFGTHILTFNADSDLVFMAKFADGSEGIFTATVLPEPAGILLLLLGSSLLLRRKSFVQ